MKIEHIILIGILILTSYTVFIPKLNYKYPIHVAEWEMMTDMMAIKKAESTVFLNMHNGEQIITNSLEIMPKVLFVVMNNFGIDLLWIFRFMPIFFMCLLIVSVYLLARKKGYGLEAAFLCSFIPTTVRLLGPSFLVAVSICLFLIPLTLWLVFYKKKIFGCLIIFLTFLFYSHPPTAIAVCMFLGIYFLLNIKDTLKAKQIFFAMLISFLMFVPYVMPTLLHRGTESAQFSGGIFIDAIWEYFGIIPLLLFIPGIYFLSHDPDKKDLTILFSVITLFVLLIIFRQYGFTLFLMPTRIHMYLFLFISVIGGLLLSKLRKIKKMPEIYIFLILLVLILSVNSHKKEPYYHIINNKDYENFIWIKENIHEGNAVLYPWKAIGFPAISEIPVYSYIPRGPNSYYFERNSELLKFLNNDCKDDDFIVDNDISVIYGAKCNNKILENPRPNIYVVEK